MSPIPARRGARALDRKTGYTASVIGILVVVAVLALLSRLLPTHSGTFHTSAFAPRHFRSLAGAGVLAGDLGHTAFRMLGATIIGTLLASFLALIARKNILLNRVIHSLVGGMQVLPLLCLLPFLHLLGFEWAALGVTSFCLAGPIASSVIASWRSLPRPLDEASRALGLTDWQRLWRLEAPYAIPDGVTALARAMPMAWCILIAGEMLPVSGQFASQPGLGTHAAQAAALGSIWQAILAALLMILLALIYDVCLVFPWQIWADRYRVSPVFVNIDDPWMLRFWRRTRLLKRSGEILRRGLAWLGTMRLGRNGFRPLGHGKISSHKTGRFCTMIAIVIVFGFFYNHHALGFQDFVTVCAQSVISGFKITIALALALAVWTPMGVWLGLNGHLALPMRRITRFLTLYPKNILFPLGMAVLVSLGLSTGLSSLLLTFFFIQWIVLANILRGMRGFPVDLLQAARNLQVRGRIWWFRVLLPGLAPALLEGLGAASITGWTISILTERGSWKNQDFSASGIGAYVARAVETGNLPHVILGTAALIFCITLGELLVWRPLRLQIERRIQSHHP